MSIDFTRPSLLRTVLYFVVFYAIFRGREFLPADPQQAASTMMPLEAALAGFFGRHIVLTEVVTFFFAFLNAFYITRILSRNLIFLERTYLPALVYLLVATGYTSSQLSVIMLAVSFLVIYAIDSMIRSHKKSGNFGHFLHASVVLGLAPLLYAPSVIYFGLLLVGFAVFRKDGRSIVISLAGYLLPIFFCSYILWGMKEPFLLTVQQIGTIVTTPDPEALFIFRMTAWDYALTALFLLLTIIGLVNFAQKYKSMRSRAQNGYRMFAWSLVVALGMVALPCRSLDMLPMLAVPLAVIIPACFNRQLGWVPNLLYILLMGSMLAYNLLPYLPLFTA